MHVGTDAQVVEFLTDSKWDCGIRVDGTYLYYDGPEANCFELKFPDLPGRAAYFSSRATRLGLVDDEAQFQGALLWITFSELGSLAPIGWKLIERMRQGFGENRPLQTARAHYFRNDELLDLSAFLLPCFAFGWPPHVRVQLRKLRGHFLQDLIHHLADRPQRMVRRHSLLWRNVAEHSFLLIIVPAHSLASLTFLTSDKFFDLKLQKKGVFQQTVSRVIGQVPY